MKKGVKIAVIIIAAVLALALVGVAIIFPLLPSITSDCCRLDYYVSFLSKMV